jgi:hypothetical protein
MMKDAVGDAETTVETESAIGTIETDMIETVIEGKSLAIFSHKNFTTSFLFDRSSKYRRGRSRSSSNNKHESSSSRSSSLSLGSGHKKSHRDNRSRKDKDRHYRERDSSRDHRRNRDYDRDRYGSSHRQRRDRDRDRKKDSMADHPYFKKKPVKKNPQKVDENGNELFWDGFQWVPR